MSPKPLDDYFAEGVQAREDGKHSSANPYCIGSEERREWAAGFNATVDTETDDDLDLDPNEDNKVRPAGR